MRRRKRFGLVVVPVLVTVLAGGTVGAQEDEAPTAKGAGAPSRFADEPRTSSDSADPLPSLTAMARAEGAVELIVGVEPGHDATATVATVAGVPLEDVRPVIDGVVAVTVDEEALARLDADPTIATIEHNAPLELSLSQSSPRVGADVARTSGHTGAGRRIAIIDSGIDSNHPTFPAGAISESESACFVWDIDVADPCPGGTPDAWGAGAAAPCTAPGCGHGTHVASIAAGRGAAGLQPGVAPGAEIIPIRIFYTAPDGGSTADTVDLVRALEYLATRDQFDSIDVVNLSLGFSQSATSRFCDGAMAQVTVGVERLRRQGVVVVAATGNDGGSDGVAVPACISSATPVTATLDSSDDVWVGSDTGSVVSLAAPGTSITAAWPGGGTRTLSGTSMAAPHVAGAVALLRERYGEQSVTWIEEHLWSTGVSVTDPTNGLQLRRIDVAAALGLRAVQPRPAADVLFAVTNDGYVLTAGDAFNWGDNPERVWGEMIVAGSATRSGMGYWLVSNRGRVHAYGDAAFHGDMSSKPLNQPISAMATTPSGGGYWLLAEDGGIFTFGDARFFGSTGAMTLNAPVTDMAPTPSGAGYWLTAKDGGVFSFGDARFYGSTGAMTLNQPVVSMAAHPTRGYWLVALDGGVFAFSVPFHGSLPGAGVTTTVGHRVRATAGGRGYYITTRDGGFYPFGLAQDYGSTDPLPPFVEVVDLMIPPA